MTSQLENLRLDDRGIAFDPATGETFRLVGPAVQLVRLLQQGAGSAALLENLLETYQVDEPTARRDLDAFLATLERLNWVESAS